MDLFCRYRLLVSLLVSSLFEQLIKRPLHQRPHAGLTAGTDRHEDVARLESIMSDSARLHISQQLIPLQSLPLIQDSHFALHIMWQPSTGLLECLSYKEKKETSKSNIILNKTFKFTNNTVNQQCSKLSKDIEGIGNLTIF